MIRFLLALAVVPGAVLLYYVYKMDKLEKEPVSLLVKLLLLGAISTIPAALLEQLGSTLLTAVFGDSLFCLFLTYMVVVGLVEELCKFAFLYWGSWKNPAFNCAFDGIVYAVFVSLGFAILENIQYVFHYGLLTGLLRAVTAVPGHACFGVIMGCLYEGAKSASLMGYPESARKNLRASVLIPAVLHGLYDYLASTQSIHGTLSFLGLLAFIFYLGYKLVKNCSQKDRPFPTRERDEVSL